MRHLSFCLAILDTFSNRLINPLIKTLSDYIKFIKQHKNVSHRVYIVEGEEINFTVVYKLESILRDTSWSVKNNCFIRDDIPFYSMSNSSSELTINPLYFTLQLIHQFLQYHKFHSIPCEEIQTQEQCFNYIPDNHESRSTNSSFFLQNGKVLRNMLTMFWENTLDCEYERMYTLGRVYRVDDDSTHLPCFYQVDLIWKDTLDYHHIESLIKGLMQFILHQFAKKFNLSIDYEFIFRTRFHYFPYVNRALEIDCFDSREGIWLEILGGGVSNKCVMSYLACGMGIERICLIICNILSQTNSQFEQFRNIHDLYHNIKLTITP